MTNQKFTSKLSTCEDLLLPYFVLSFNISNYAVRIKFTQKCRPDFCVVNNLFEVNAKCKKLHIKSME